MKTFLFLFIIALAANTITAQQTYVPDDNFEQALIFLGYDTPPLNDSVPTKNIVNVTHLSIDNIGINDLTGIEDFKSLRGLGCERNHLRSLNLSNNLALDVLNCYNNYITTLDLSKNTSLIILDCHNNELNSLDVSNCSLLKELKCFNNKLTVLNISGCTNLYELDCNNNALSKLELISCSKLVKLHCFDNQLTTLTIKECEKLTDIACQNNLIENLEVSDCFNLVKLYCNNNNITKLDVSVCSVLTKLFCYDNHLESLNIKNGNNLMMANLPSTGLFAWNNPELFCIEVDDTSNIHTYSNWHKDDHAIYSEDCSLVSVEEGKYAGESITISPNPAEDYVEVKINDVILNEVKNPVLSVKIFDLLGAEITTSPPAPLHNGEGRNFKIDVSSLPKGVYFLKIGDVFKKFIKL